MMVADGRTLTDAVATHFFANATHAVSQWEIKLSNHSRNASRLEDEKDIASSERFQLPPFYLCDDLIDALQHFARAHTVIQFAEDDDRPRTRQLSPKK